MYSGIIAAGTQIFAFITYFIIAAKAMQGMISIGDVLLYASAVNALTNAIQNLVQEYFIISCRSKYLKNYEVFINKPNMHYDGTLPIEKRLDGAYEFIFQDVSFHYPQNKEFFYLILILPLV